MRQTQLAGCDPAVVKRGARSFPLVVRRPTGALADPAANLTAPALWRLCAGMLLTSAFAGTAGAATVQGTLLYEKIPATLRGLDFAKPVSAPAGKIRVELRTASQTRVLARGVTGEDGSYRFVVPNGTGPVLLAIFAQSGNLQVGDPTTRRLYGTTTAAFDPARAPKRVVIPDQNRQSGPFNILATIRQANARLAQIDPSFPIQDIALTIYWGSSNRDSSFHGSENALYLRGVREENSDEFDDTVILHEYGHFLAHQFSRDDAFPGPHSPGERLDPRQAWSEGWATFLALAMLGTPIYIDTLGPGGTSVFAWDMEADAPEWDKPGYWSEHSVGSALWDLFADPAISSDHVGLGFQPIWQAFREHLPQQVFIYLLTMADGLVEADGSRSGGITAVLAKRQMVYRSGVVPPVDVPFPGLISPGNPVTGSVDSRRSQRYNLMGSADYYRFRIESSQSVEIQLQVTGPSASGAADLELVLYDAQGKFITLVDDQHGVGSLERVTQTLPAGTYVIGVWSFRWTGSQFLFDGGNYRLTARF
jgi:hypothetical protein